jgi:hypothetical protein
MAHRLLVEWSADTPRSLIVSSRFWKLSGYATYQRMQTRITSIGKRVPLIDDCRFAHHGAFLTGALLDDSIRRSRPRCSIRLRRCAATGNGLTAILAWTASRSTRSTGAGTYATDPMSRIAVWTAAKPTGCRDRGSAVHPTIYQCAGGTIGPPRVTARMKPGCCCRRARYAAMVG